MTPSEANFFVVDEVTPRVYGKSMDDVVRGDWIRATSKPWVTLVIARVAIQRMVDAGTPFKVSSFVNVMKKIKPEGDAEITHSVHLFSIRVQRHRLANGSWGKEKRMMKWSYATPFCVGSQKAVPLPEQIQRIANYWATRLDGVIEWTEGYCPIKEADIPF